MKTKLYTPSPPHPANVPGDFYVEDGCCMTCGIPSSVAPDVFAYTDDGLHCYVAHQPATPSAVHRTLEAMHDAEVECIRYRGTDTDVFSRLVEMGVDHLSDQVVATKSKRLVRTHVSFVTTETTDARMLLSDFVEHFIRRHADGKARPARGKASAARVKVSWYGKDFHEVRLNRLAENRWLAEVIPRQIPAASGIARTVGNWLGDSPPIHDVRWYTKAQWIAGGPWKSTVL